ncbi:hypothetical protein UFOVP770_12 [uncultured Caudovirales phage]|jgi:hypothetical protein|uniref:Uncharacterized protein n=1 Tax=uncultured Caudovirales phage TaxID=2100421 RepID=A0A6J5NPL2_9CAUD|nr:hypothetical protein UFOVP770_12 [uncultured Caudovirales phage]
MTFSVTPLVGIDLDNVVTAASIAAGQQVANQLLGVQVWGSDGKRYVFAKANATIAASTAVCDINTTTFLVAATGGSYLSPAYGMVSGDFGWFSKASV